MGIHLVLTTGRPILDNNHLVAENGKFHRLKDYPVARKKMTNTQIFDEWCAQIDYLLDLGLEPTHFDSHHHVHFFKENHEITQLISQKYKLPFRNSYGTENFTDFKLNMVNDLLLDMMNTKMIRDMSKPYDEIKEECLEELTKTLDKGKEVHILEMMVHPAFVDEHLYQNSSFNVQRVREVEILIDPLVKQLIEDNEYELVNFRTAVL